MKLYSTGTLKGRPIAATDEDIGKCADLLLDDRDWTLRYLVVDTGHWLPGRKVVISPAEIARHGPLTPDGHIQTRLTRHQIKESPSLEEHAPVSRQLEQQLAAYYGWPAYWEGGALWGTAAMQPDPIAAELGSKLSPNLTESAQAENHLHSARELGHYANHAADGDLGSLRELLFDPDPWQVRYAVLKTSRWFGGSLRVFPVKWIDHIDAVGRIIFTQQSREAIRACPEVETAEILDEATVERIQEYFR